MSAILSPRHAQAEDGDAEMESVVPLVVAEVGAANAPAEAAKNRSQLRISADKLGLAGLDAQHVSGELLEELYEEEVGLGPTYLLCCGRARSRHQQHCPGQGARQRDACNHALPDFSHAVASSVASFVASLLRRPFRSSLRDCGAKQLRTATNGLRCFVPSRPA